MKSKIIILTIFLWSSYSSAKILTISEAYNLALENSKEIKSAEYQVEANREQLNQAKAQLYPQLYLSSNFGQKEYDGRGAGSISSYAISINQSVYDKSKIETIHVAKSRVKLDNFRIEFQKQELAQKVLKIYMDIVKSQNKMEVFNAYLNAKERKVQLLSKKLELSLGTKTDLLQGEVDLHSSKIDLRREERLIEVNKLKLKHLTGVDDIEIPNINLDMVTDSIVYSMRSVIEQNIDRIDSNLKLEQSRMKLDLSQKEIKRAKAGHMPTVNINAQYSKVDADAKVSSLENTKSLMLQVQLPLYQGGAVESKIAESKLSYNSAQEDFLQVQDEIEEEYEENLATFDSASKSIAMYQESLNSAREYRNSIQQSFNAGLKSSIDLTSAESKLYEIKYRFVENIYDMINAYIDLLIVTNSFENLNLVDEIIK